MGQATRTLSDFVALNSFTCRGVAAGAASGPPAPGEAHVAIWEARSPAAYREGGVMVMRYGTAQYSALQLDPTPIAYETLTKKWRVRCGGG